MQLKGDKKKRFFKGINAFSQIVPKFTQKNTQMGPKRKLNV